MSVQRHYRSGAPRKPQLTIDTSPSPNSLGDGPAALSAPVGTRQEQGMVPMHQAGDRHVARLAELMESPTWRSQNPGPHVRNEAPALAYDQAGADPRKVAPALRYNQTKSRASVATGQALENFHNRQAARTPEDLRLNLSQVGHEVKILDIQRFPKTPETSDNTFILSATVSQQRLIQEALRLRPGQQVAENDRQESEHNAAFKSRAPADLDGGARLYRQEVDKNNATIKSRAPAYSGGGASLNRHEEYDNDAAFKSRAPVYLDGGARLNRFEEDDNDAAFKSCAPAHLNGGARLNRVEEANNNNAACKSRAPAFSDGGARLNRHEENDKDAASKSRAPVHHDGGARLDRREVCKTDQDTQENQKRFNELISRLHRGSKQQEPAKKTSPPADPAILSFGLKKDEPSTTTPSKDDASRVRSDSGYGSMHSAYHTLSASTRPSTRSSRLSAEVSGSADSDDSPSKNSALNPTAKEFAVPNGNKFSPAKQASLAPSAFGNRTLAMPGQHVQGMVPEMHNSQMPSAQGLWFTQGLQYHQTPRPVYNQALIQQLGYMQQEVQQQQAMLQGTMTGAMPQAPMLGPIQGALPGPLPNWGSNFHGQTVPPMAGINSTPRNFMGLNHVSGLGVPGLGTPPALAPPVVPTPFHHQLDAVAMGQYNNFHQQSPYTPTPTAPVGRIPAVQNTGVLGTQNVMTGSAMPFIPKHVPKPKVPDTMGQQSWEMVHEIRRMTEPGYAQKCKEKQKKRFQKQLEKAGGQS